MKFAPSISLALAATGLLFLGACASTPTTSTTTSAPDSVAAPAESPASLAISPEASAEGDAEGVSNKGGQVVEAGAYHLELVPEPEADAIHLDLYLQNGDDHEAIADAKVTAQVQLPDGSQKSLDMKYDAEDKHYTGILPTTATGEYKVAVLTDIGGEKVNGRFNFTK